MRDAFPHDPRPESVRPISKVDEAHRTAGAAGKAFSRVLRDDHVPGDRRLFLTATPRVHTVAAKVPDKGGETLLMSMDDETVYGPQVYTLSVAEAVERGILSQYQVAVIGVSNAELSGAAQALDTVMVDGHELNTDHVASIIALSKAARSIGLHSVIAYFNSRAASKAFVKAFQIVHSSRSMLLSGGTAEHIDGNMRLADRAAALSRLATVGDDGFHLVSNARCLTEGIDVPVLDGVLFGEPRSSQIDVVQCVGRAIRKNPRTDNPALIVMAVRTGDGQDAETAIAEAGFTKVRQVISALGDHDPRIAEAARTLSRHRSDDAGDGSSDRPTGEELKNARRLISLDFPPELLHNGFGLRMLMHRDDQAWERGCAELRKYVRETGHARVPQRYVSSAGFRLGYWVNNRRVDYREGRLVADRVETLATVAGWVWCVDDVSPYVRGLSELRSYVEREGHARVPKVFTTAAGYRLGRFVGELRNAHRTGALDTDLTLALESLCGWTWDARSDSWWYGNLSTLRRHGLNGGACDGAGRAADSAACGFDVSAWLDSQRKAYFDGVLSGDKIILLESLPGWVWDPSTS